MENIHILIAEDDESMQNSLSFILEDEGYKVSTAFNGDEAIEIIYNCINTNKPVDLLITDIQMPEKNGLELIKQLIESKIKIAKIVITGHGDKDLLINLIRLGCDDFLAKPFEPDEVCQKVSEVISKYKLIKEEDNKKTETLLKKNIDLSLEVEKYRKTVKNIKKELNNAIITYNDLIKLKNSNYNIPIAYKVKALKDLGGDYFNICDTSCGSDIIVADVAGHDMAASYHTIIIKSFFDEYSRSLKNTHEFLTILNQALLENGQNERMVTAIFLSIDIDNMYAHFVSAGHPKALIISNKNENIKYIDIIGNILGLNSKVELDQKKLKIEEGDRIILYTDGIVNSYYIDGPTGKRFFLGEKGLKNLVDKYKNENLSSFIDHLWNDIMAYCKYKQKDDMLLFGIEIPSNKNK